jgi:SagB-type dehydrogenase family enzyme
VLADIAGSGTLLATDPGSSQKIDSLLEEIQRRGRSLMTSSRLTPTTLAAIKEAHGIAVSSRTVSEPETRVRRRIRLKVTSILRTRFETVLSSRTSHRAFGSLDESELAALLFHACRIRSSWSQAGGYRATSRAAPSAGARHPIDILVVREGPDRFRADRLRSTRVYLFDPLTTDFCQLDASLARILRSTNAHAAKLLGSRPPATLCLLARIDRTLARYPGGLSLVYRDTGALMATIMMVATSLGLASCPLFAGVDTHARHDLLRWGWVDVGGVAVGGLLRRR